MKLSRRRFLLGSGLVGGGLILGFYFGRGDAPVPGTIAGSFQPNSWLQITSDNRFIFQLHKVEMGQGVVTALPLLMGEELDLDPARFEIAMAGVHPDFAMQEIGLQITGGSHSVGSSWEVLRHAGAAARAMLCAAAASGWNIPVEQCATDNGEVINTVSGERVSYGDLAERAGTLNDVEYHLKSPENWRWIGSDYPRLDRVSKSTGTAEFGMDVVLEGMKTAVIVRCPYFGGSVQSWDPGTVSSLDGVIDAFVVHSGIAIVAEGYWQARQAAAKLEVNWDKGPLAGLSSEAILEGQRQALIDADPYIGMERGDVEAVHDSQALLVQARYSAPYTHHSPMEPQNATAIYTEDSAGNRCEVWAPNQAPDISRALIAHYGDVSHDNAIIHTTLLGGGFGRRGYPDFVGEVVAIARQMPGVPIKLIWSREDDMQHDFYRPSSLHALEGRVDDRGRVVSWRHNVVSPSIMRGFGVHLMAAVLPTWVPTAFARSMGKVLGNTMAHFDSSSLEGAKIPYDFDNVAVGHVEHDPGIPVGFWRSVAFSHNVFAVECFVDELCQVAGADPLAFRLDHLQQEPRYRGVLNLVAEKAGWGSAPEGISQGLAIAQPFKTYCAMVVEVSVKNDLFTVSRVIAAVDCGQVVTPHIVRTQVESGIIYALTAALKSPVTFVDGKTVQSNFHDLPVLRIDETPLMEVYLVDSEEAPTGIGEIGVPALAPALVNAVYAATGRRQRDLPLRQA